MSRYVRTVATGNSTDLENQLLPHILTMLSNHFGLFRSRVNDTLTLWPAAPLISGENAQAPFLAARSGFAVTTDPGTVDYAPYRDKKGSIAGNIAPRTS